MMPQFFRTILIFVLIFFRAVYSSHSQGLSKPSNVELDGGCTFNLDTDSPKNPSHLINKQSQQIIQPVLEGSSRLLSLTQGQHVAIVCEGKNNLLSATGHQINKATCFSRNLLQIENLKIRIGYNETGCQKAVKETIREASTCHNNATRIEIGWQIEGDFIEQLTLCHDKSAAITLYSIGRIIGASIQADDQTNKRPSFRKGRYYAGIDVNRAYSQAGQLLTMTRMFGTRLAQQYINLSKNYYLARGHLTPDGDFIDAASQDATYYFINVLPQWQSVNNGNWKALELAVRSLAADRAASFTTYTGGFDVLNLTDSKGQETAVHLARDDDDNNILAVPKYLWKVVHDPLSATAIAFVAFNNPHMSGLKAGDVFCRDVCDRVPWVTWQRRRVSSGYTFCCTVRQLRQVVPYAPSLGDLPLLI